MRRDKSDFSKEVVGFASEHGLHPDLELAAGGVVLIKRHDTRSDEPEAKYAIFDLKKFWLPANKVYDSPTALLSRDDLVCAILLFLNDFMFRTRSAKGRHNRARVEAKQCIKFFEYMWLHGYLKLSTVPQSLMVEFAQDIANRGWIGVLDIRSRVSHLASEGSTLSLLPRIEFSNALATNIEGSDFGLIYESYISMVESGDEPVLHAHPLGFSSMRHLLGALNHLSGISGEIGLRKYPYLNSVALSTSLTSTPGRTPNMSPRDAAILFSGSFEILLSLANPVIALLKEISSLVIGNFNAGRFELGSGIEHLVIGSGIDQKIIFPPKPGRNNSNGNGGNYVCALILFIMTACFVILAVCNARRRDEIQHRKFGIHYGCSKVMSEELGLYTSEFYIEKTLLDYSVFFINGISRRAICTLEAIQSEFYRVDLALGRSDAALTDRDKNLFAYRRISELEGIGKDNCWFNFSDNKRGYVARFLDYIFPGGRRLEVSAHMFRRLYGLLFMYRHELPEVQALSYQYQHDCFSATVTYITDPAVEDDLNSIFNLYGVNPEIVKKAYSSHCEDLQESLLGIARERMAELVEFTLGGVEGRGGFTKFLKSVYRKYLNSVEFVNLTPGEQAEIVSDRFLTRGHLPNPFRHSICVASPTKHSASARCSSPDKKLLRPELASPSVCHGCPFQYLNERHIANMIEDREFLSSELENAPEASTIALQLGEQLVNLNKIIDFHERSRAS